MIEILLGAGIFLLGFWIGSYYYRRKLLKHYADTTMDLRKMFACVQRQYDLTLKDNIILKRHKAELKEEIRNART